MSKQQLVWKKKPEVEDYDGALEFLSLVCFAIRIRLVYRIVNPRPIDGGNQER
jgi:hypothetical protein